MNNIGVLREIAEETVSKLKDGIGLDYDGCDLHHYLWNEDYFIIGYYQAEKWIEKYMSIFEAIKEIQGYEKFHFGATNTDISSAEQVANMLAYIYGYEVLGCSKHMDKMWDRKLDEEDLEIIIEEIEYKYGL